MPQATACPSPFPALRFITYVAPSFASQFSYSIDGGAATTVNAQAAALTDGKAVRVTRPDTSTHTLTIAWVAGGAYIDGVVVSNGDESKGLRFYEGGHFGWVASQVADPSLQWQGCIETIQPALVCVEFGVNEYRNGVSPQTYQDGLSALVAKVRGQCVVPPSVVLMVTYEPAAWTVVAPWSEYVSAAYDLADTDGDMAVLDLGMRMPAAATDTRGLFDAGKVHPTTIGHAMIADSVAGFLTPR